MPKVYFIQPDGRAHDSGMCERNLNLLAHAQAIELDIGSQCGGHGVCGGDRLQVQGDATAFSPITEVERRHFTPAELNAGWRLGCQCFLDKTDSNIQVLLPDRI